MHVDTNAIRGYAGFIVDKVVLKAEEILGNLKKQFDFLMIFLPLTPYLAVQQTGRPYMHHYLSVCNNR